MVFRVTLLVIMSSLATAQTNTRIDCKSRPELCEVTVGGHILTFGMQKDQVLGLLSKSYTISEVIEWSAAHKPDSMWYLKDKQGIKGGVQFKAEKLDGAMVDWSPDSNEGGDFAANVVNLLQRFYKEGSTNCVLTIDGTTTPRQDQRVARFQCGLRSVIVEHNQFSATLQGDKLPEMGRIVETFGSW